MVSRGNKRFWSVRSVLVLENPLGFEHLLLGVNLCGFPPGAHAVLRPALVRVWKPQNLAAADTLVPALWPWAVGL